MKITPRIPQRSFTIERERSVTVIAMFTFHIPNREVSIRKDKTILSLIKAAADHTTRYTSP